MDGASARYVSNPLEVLYASGSSASDAVYTVVNAGDHTQMIVYAPHFSTHPLSIQGISFFDEVTGPLGIGVVVSALAIIRVAAVVLL